MPGENHRSFIELTRELGERLGGEPFVNPIERAVAIATMPQRIGRADVWPPETLEEIRRIYAEMDGK